MKEFIKSLLLYFLLGALATAMLILSITVYLQSNSVVSIGAIVVSVLMLIIIILVISTKFVDIDFECENEQVAVCQEWLESTVIKLVRAQYLQCKRMDAYTQKACDDINLINIDKGGDKYGEKNA